MMLHPLVFEGKILQAAVPKKRQVVPVRLGSRHRLCRLGNGRAVCNDDISGNPARSFQHRRKRGGDSSLISVCYPTPGVDGGTYFRHVMGLDPCATGMLLVARSATVVFAVVVESADRANESVGDHRKVESRKCPYTA